MLQASSNYPSIPSCSSPKYTYQPYIIKWYSSCDDCMHLYGSICKLSGFLNVYSCECAMHIYTINLFLNQGCAWFLKIDPMRIVSMCVCVCVCPRGY